MPCSICNSEGHNSKTCSSIENKISPRSFALWLKFDGLTETEANELLKNSIDAKTKIAPNACGTFAKGSQAEIPKKIKEALALEERKGGISCW